MTRPFLLTLQLVAGTLLAALLGGCVNLDPQLDTTRFYTLTPPFPSRTGLRPEESVHAALRVSAGADYLKQPAIAVRQTPQEIVLQEGHRWAERIDLGLARVVQDGLERRNKTLSVDALARNPGGDHQLLIDIAITACEGTRDGGAKLDADWQIFAGSDTTPVASGRYHEIKPDWNGQDFGRLAELLSQLADELAGEIAPSIAQANL